MCIEQWLIFRPNHRERTPGLLPFLCLLEQGIIEIMGPEGHSIDSLDDLGITFLFKLIILSKQFQKMRKTLVLIFQHDPFQLPLQIEFLKDGMFLHRTDLRHFITELLLVLGHFSRSEFDPEQLDNGTEQVVYLLKEEINRQGQDLQVDHSCAFLLGLFRSIRAKLRSQLIKFLSQEVVLPLELLDLQEQKLLLLLRTDLLLTPVQTHQRSRRLLPHGRPLGSLLDLDLFLLGGFYGDGDGRRFGGVDLWASGDLFALHFSLSVLYIAYKGVG